jgi:hypothetical protein
MSKVESRGRIVASFAGALLGYDPNITAEQAMERFVNDYYGIERVDNELATLIQSYNIACLRVYRFPFGNKCGMPRYCEIIGVIGEQRHL